MQDFKAILESDNYYHIYNRANGREKLFVNDTNYNFFLKQYEFYISPIADTFAYCLMPNHFHFLVKIKSEEELRSLSGFQTLTGIGVSKKLSQQFSHFFNSYTQAFNKQQNRKGGLFSRAFNRKRITSEGYLKNTINYIHQNPITHGYTKELDTWKFSSYNSFLSNKSTRIQKQEAFGLFHDKQNFIDYHTIKKAEYFAIKTSLDY